MRIGILALQGAFVEHAHAFRRLGVDSFEIRKRADADGTMDGLVLPGGESTVMRKLLIETGLFHPLRHMMRGGLPVFGTCAGLILLAREVTGDNGNACFGVLDACVERNAYGRQLGSFHVTAHYVGVGSVPMVFIRAPFVASAGEGVDVLAVVDGRIVAVRQGNVLATAFHPELTEDTAMHRYFLSMVQSASVPPFLKAVDF